MSSSKIPSQTIRSTLCPAVIDTDIPMLDIAGFARAAPERVNDVYDWPDDSMLRSPIIGA
jgi:hypothetical protein